MIPVTGAYPALLRLTLRCLTCHGGVGVLLGCIFFLFFPPSFFLLGVCSFEAAISIGVFFFFSFLFFPPFFFVAVLGCVHSGLLDYIS